jgi:cytochrome c553
MQPVAAELNAEAIRELAHYYHGLPSSPAQRRQPMNQEMIERGKTIATRGLPRQRVPACLSCHDPTRRGRNPAYPDLAGQYEEYLVLQLDLFKRQKRGGSAYEHVMRAVAAGLRPEQMRDVAAYFAALPPPTQSQREE